MSDQHLAIQNAVSSLLPECEHRLCARHLFANWHKTHKGDELKGLFWRACGAYCQADYNEALANMRQVSPEACRAFEVLPKDRFCRAFLMVHNKVDVIVNNMAENFNAYIINARSKHLLDLLRGIRSSLMQRMFMKRESMQKYEEFLCPNVTEKLRKSEIEAANCDPMPSSEGIFEVNHGIDTLIVDLNQQTCTCRYWDMTGVPCCHVVAVMYFMQKSPHSLVHPYFTRQSYMKSYCHSVPTSKGERHWPDVVMPIDPPQIKIQPGRPRKNRIKCPHEDPKKKGRLTRDGMEMTCTICRNKGHNKRGCPMKDTYNPAEQPPPPPPRKRGRPRKDTTNSATTTLPSQQTEATAQPGRRGRGRGRGGGNRAGRSVRGGRSGRGLPAGFGAYVEPDGSTYVSVGGQLRPVAEASQSSQTISGAYPSSQISNSSQ